MIVDLLQRLSAYVFIVIVGVILYRIGNLLLGRKGEGGKRLILCLAGLFICAFSVCVFWLIIPAQLSQWIPWSIFGLAFAIGGIALVGLSVFASNEAIRRYFSRFLDGI